ncbi:AcrR family transcriptional regulator [Microbacterium resistens]|uniref:AcrR family transcriptional regulator n=1 Tax=Microbacterium resistens TaxID=156977 RepID=A0ABU1SG49_9MICO|nr:TetR family transcriptional regulator [Microbacterium resistens]MDR6868599.1 AcrR family transcriptional regulator [Microbacterium resistens]
MPENSAAAPSGRPAPGSYASGRRSRDRILGVALREFAEFGYRGAAMTRIAERAGISEAGLRHHFRSKDELLIEILRGRDDRSNRLWEEAGAPVGIADLEYNLRLMELNAAAPDLARLFAVVIGESVTQGHPAAEWASTRYRALVATMAESVQGGIDAGEFRADTDTARIGRQIVAVMDGLQTQWLLDPDGVDLAAEFRGYIDGLIALLRPVPPADAGAGADLSAGAG